MDSGKARQIYKKYAGAMAYVAVESPDGTPGIGSAFHVGEGVFVTARHVVENKRIVEVSGVLQIEQGPFFHPDQDVDVAVFQVAGNYENRPYVYLGSHLDDWLGLDDFVLMEAIVLGYPPIPMTNEPHLVASRAEISAQVDLRHGKHVHFILSAMPRGGFSGGVTILENEVVLGVVTSSLLYDGKESELGFFTVLTVEPIFQCLAEYKLLPEIQAEGWNDLWNSNTKYFYVRPHNQGKSGGSVGASIGIFDDGKRLYLELMCDDTKVFEDAVNSAKRAFGEIGIRCIEIRSGMVKLEVISPDDKARKTIFRASDAVTAIFVEGELTPCPYADF